MGRHVQEDELEELPYVDLFQIKESSFYSENLFSVTNLKMLTPDSGTFRLPMDSEEQRLCYIKTKPGIKYKLLREQPLGSRFRVYQSKEEPDIGVDYQVLQANNDTDQELKLENIELSEGYNYMVFYVRLSDNIQEIINQKTQIKRQEASDEYELSKIDLIIELINS